MIDSTDGPSVARAPRDVGSVIEHLTRCISRGIALLIRVSSPLQAGNVGSLAFQRKQIQHLVPYGASVEKVRLFDATKEPAKAGVDRPIFRQLLAAVRAGEVGVVVVADVDRVTRNDTDGEDLFDALAEIDGILVVSGEIYDPLNPSHRMIFQIRASVAQFENSQRAIRSLSARSTLAQTLGARVKLPVGLIWGSPDDAEFCKRMSEAGFGADIAPEALAKHRTTAARDGLRYFVFPCPDPDVHVAARLAMSWVMETGSIRGAVERIEQDPAWPRPGLFPVSLATQFRPDGALAEWRPLVSREDGKRELAATRLYDWLRSPALYGIYAFRPRRLRRVSRGAAALASDVWEEGAFPSIATPDDYVRMRELLSNPDHPRIRGSWTGPRNHALPGLVCAHPMPGGLVCGRRLAAMYATGRGGEHRYLSVACGVRGHRYSLPPTIEQTVLDLICGVFTRERLRGELDAIRRDEGADASRLRDLRESVQKLQDRVRYDDDRSFEARRRGDPDDETFYEGQRHLHSEALRSAERELARLNAARADLARVTDAEYRDIVKLAEDLPCLLRLARPLEGKVREIVREVVRRVHARRLATHTFHVEVEFRSGERVGRTVVTRLIDAPKAVRTLAAGRLAEWLDPRRRDTLEKEEAGRAQATALAADLNTLLEPATPWTADRVFAAAYMAEPSPRPRGSLATVADLADRTGVSVALLRAAALRDHLGPAWYESGELAVSASEKALQAAFPEYALRTVAEATGWPASDIAALGVLARETGWDRYRVRRVAERGAGIAKDATGERYTRRSLFKVPSDDDVQRMLEAAIPEWGDRQSGRWLTWTEARRLLPGVNIRTFERHGAVVQPGWGENGIATSYVWIDPRVEAEVRKPSLPEALAYRGLNPSSAPDFVLRDEALERLRDVVGPAAGYRWKRAVHAGNIVEIRARAGTQRLRTWAYVPREVMDSGNAAAFERLLAGAYRSASAEGNGGAT